MSPPSSRASESAPPDAGMTLLEIMIVVAIVGILTTLVIPMFTRFREQTQKALCIQNLKMIEYSKEMWALSGDATPGATAVWTDIAPYTNHTNKELLCPVDPQKTFATSYNVGDLKQEPACRINPAQHNLD